VPVSGTLRCGRRADAVCCYVEAAWSRGDSMGDSWTHAAHDPPARLCWCTSSNTSCACDRIVRRGRHGRRLHERGPHRQLHVRGVPSSRPNNGIVGRWWRAWPRGLCRLVGRLLQSVVHHRRRTTVRRRCRQWCSV
jgi:hypothetical protein